MKFTLLLIIAIIDFSYSKNSPTTEEVKLWTYLRGRLHFSEECTASLMGNLYAESGLKSGSYDIAYHQELGLTDSEYVRQVNKGQYSKDKFINDNIGFGLAQWRDSNKKQGLYQLCHGKIGDLVCQVSYIEEEITSNLDSDIYNKLKTTKTISKCNFFLINYYFKNYSLSSDEENRRIQFAEVFYEIYVKKNIDMIKNYPL